MLETVLALLFLLVAPNLRCVIMPLFKAHASALGLRADHRTFPRLIHQGWDSKQPIGSPFPPGCGSEQKLEPRPPSPQSPRSTAALPSVAHWGPEQNIGLPQRDFSFVS